MALRTTAHRSFPAGHGLLAGLLFSAATAPAALAVGTFAMDAHVIGAGFSQRDASACFEVASTIGQPLIGGAFTGGDYSAYAGFWRAFPPDVDTVFSARFERCGP
jgi:hypothetical protein